MSWLGGWLREIILVVLLAAFVELLLPSKSMERYARLVLSLLVLLTILGPIVSLMKGDAASELALAFRQTDGEGTGHGGTADTELQKILADGQKLAAGGRDRSLKLAAREIAGQMKEQIATETGRQGANVAVTLALTDGSGPGRTPVITEVVVTLPAAGSAVRDGETPNSSDVGGSGDEAGEGPVRVKPVDDIKVELGGSDSKLEERGDSGGAAEPAAAGTEESADAKAVTSLLEKNWSLDPSRIKVTGGASKG